MLSSATQNFMKTSKRLVFLLLLNILISVIATMTVLRYWESHPNIVIQPTSLVTVLITTTPASNGSTFSQTSPALTILTATHEIIPSPSNSIPNQAYQVQAGDTLSTIAILFKVGIDDIMRTNNLDDPNSLYTGQVLFIPASPLPTYTPNFSPTPNPSATPTPKNTLTPTASPTRDTSPARVAIESVLGTNVLDLERVKIIHTGGGDVSLAGWRLKDEDGYSFNFPLLFLYPNGSVTVNTKAGSNTVVDLFWGLSQPIWQPGEKVTLYDAQNNVRAEFTIP